MSSFEIVAKRSVRKGPWGLLVEIRGESVRIRGRGGEEVTVPSELLPELIRALREFLPTDAGG